MIRGLSPMQDQPDTTPPHPRARRLRLARSLLGLPLFVLLALLPPATVQAKPLDRVAAIVGAQIISEKEVEPTIITQSEVEAVARPILDQLARKGSDVDPAKVRKKALEELIMRRLRQQEAERYKIKVTDQEVTALFGQMAKQNNLTPEQFAKAIHQQGMTQEQYLDDLRDQIVQSRILSKVIRQSVTVSDEEIKELHQTVGASGRSDEIHLGQILLTVEPNARPEKIQAVKELAKKLIGELKKGVHMATLASQYSDDASSLKGGDLGWFKRGQLQPEIEREVFPLQAGAVAGPIVTPGGLHILQVLERRSGSGMDQGNNQQARVRHILIKVPRKALPEEEEQALNKIEKIRQEIQGGASFEELAKKHSQDSSNKEGGDLGWVGRGLMVKEFEEALFELQPGKVSTPVRTSFGWHLIKMEKVRTLNPSSLGAVRTELENRVREAKSQTKYRQWLRDLRLRAFVEYR